MARGPAQPAAGRGSGEGHFINLYGISPRIFLERILNRAFSCSHSLVTALRRPTQGTVTS